MECIDTRQTTAAVRNIDCWVEVRAKLLVLQQMQASINTAKLKRILHLNKQEMRIVLRPKQPKQ